MTNQTSTKRSNFSNRRSQKTTPLDRFEHFCWIVDQYLRWPLQLVAILASFAFMNGETARTAALCILAVGSATTIKKLIDKLSGPS